MSQENLDRICENNIYFYMEKASPQQFHSLSSLFFLIIIPIILREIIFEGGLVSHRICENNYKHFVLQIQEYHSSEPESFFVNIFSSWTWNISESLIECTRGLSSLVLKFTLPTTENVDKN